MATSSSTDAPTTAPNGGPRARRAAALGGVAAVFAAAALAAVLVPRSDDAPAAVRYRAPDGAFSVAVPAGWQALDAGALRMQPAPAAVLRRRDGRGIVVIRRRPALRRSSSSLTRDLTAQLRRRFRGLAPVSARTVRLDGGPVYVYTFARPEARTVQSVAVAPRADRTYTLDAVAGAGAPDAAAQVGAIVRSFDIPDPAPRS